MGSQATTQRTRPGGRHASTIGGADAIGSPKGHAGASPDVLIADDDPAAIAYVEAILVEAGYTVASVPSGTQALEVGRVLRPRLLILDVTMPDLDGYSVCRGLRADPATSSLPILFLSASAAVDARVTGLRAGAVDFLVKPFAPAELTARVAAHLQMAELREALAHRNQELAEANSSLTAGLDAASRVQAAMLPRPSVTNERVRFAWRCLQCEQLGGDALNILRLSEGVYAVYLLDASGHGLPASLLAVSAGYFVAALAGGLLARRKSKDALSPAAILDDVNRVFGEMAPPGAFVTILIGVLNIEQRQLTFASAGHPGPLLIRPGCEPAILDEPAPPVGIRDWAYADRVVPLQARDRILFYSDGVFEQRNVTGEHFGRARLAQSIPAQSDTPAEDAIDCLIEQLTLWRGARVMDDDVSILLIDYLNGDDG